MMILWLQQVSYGEDATDASCRWQPYGG